MGARNKSGHDDGGVGALPERVPGPAAPRRLDGGIVGSKKAGSHEKSHEEKEEIQAVRESKSEHEGCQAPALVHYGPFLVRAAGRRGKGGKNEQLIKCEYYGDGHPKTHSDRCGWTQPCLTSSCIGDVLRGKTCKSPCKSCEQDEEHQYEIKVEQDRDAGARMIP